jgi:hypothetical protein
MTPGRAPSLTRQQRAEIEAACKLHRETAAKVLAAKYQVSTALIYQIFNGRVFRVEHPEDRT